MALTLGTDQGMFFRSDQRLTYTQIEAALEAAGLTNFMIMRSESGGVYDVQLSVRSTDGNPLPAMETFRALADALDALDGDDTPPPADPPADENPPADNPPPAENPGDEPPADNPPAE